MNPLMQSSIGQIGKFFAFLGGALLLLGLLLTFAPKIPLLGRLPGDLHWKTGGTDIYFPLGTSVLASIALTLLLNLILRLFR